MTSDINTDGNHIDKDTLNKITTKWKKKIEEITNNPLDRTYIRKIINEIFSLAGHKPPTVIFTGSPMANFIAVKNLIDNGMSHIGPSYGTDRSFRRHKFPKDGIIGPISLESLLNLNIPIPSYFNQIMVEPRNIQHSYYHSEDNSRAIAIQLENMKEVFSFKFYEYYLTLCENLSPADDIEYHDIPDYVPDLKLYTRIWNDLKSESDVFSEIDLDEIDFDLDELMDMNPLDSHINLLSTNYMIEAAYYDYCIEIQLTDIIPDEKTKLACRKYIEFSLAAVYNIQGVYDSQNSQHYWVISEFPKKVSVDNKGRWHNSKDYAVEFPDGWKAYFIHGSYFNEYQFDYHLQLGNIDLDILFDGDDDQVEDRYKYIGGALYDFLKNKSLNQ